MRILLFALLISLAACASNAPSRMETGGMQTVLVRPGETIDDLARRLNISPQDLIQANRLAPPYKLSPGETLIIPVPKTYIVQRGDSLSKIAERFDVSMTSIARINHLSSPYRLNVGQKLTLPDFHGQDAGPEGASAAAIAEGEKIPPPAPTTAPAATVAPGTATDRKSPTALAPPVQTASATPPPAVAAAEPAAAASGFIWPVKGDIVSGFGPKPGGLHNDGINIAAPEGTPVKAAAAGTVAYAGNDLKGFGNLILIRHSDGWITAYAHLATMSAAKGDEVNAGHVIGTVGQTGSVDSPQLHFELRHGKEAIDPTGKLG